MLTSFYNCGKLLISTGAVLWLATVAASAAVSVDFDVQPRVLRLGEAAQATVTIHGDRSPPEPPLGGLADCDVSGPSVNSQVSIVNGHMDQSVTFAYQIVPRHAGTIKIGPINYPIAGQTYQLPGLELTVTAPTTASAPGDKQGVALSDLVFARLDLAPTNLYQNQTFELYLSILYRNIHLDSGFSLLNWQPQGLSLSSFKELPAQRVQMNGQVFETRQFRCQARALSAGSMRLAPTVRGALLVQREHRQRGGPFNDPFFDRFFENSMFNQPETRPIDIATQPLDITIKPLPETGRPPDFNGAVGQFTLNARVQPDDGAVGDPITLTAQIAGHGNFEAVAFPMMGNSELFKAYDAKLTTKELDETQSNGQKTFEQVLIPRSLEAKHIPPIGFSFFDPVKSQYITLRAGPFDLKLSPSASGTAFIASPGTTAPATPTGHDIAYLKPAPTEWANSTAHESIQRPLFWPLQTIPPLAVMIAFVMARRRQLRTGDVRWARREQAPHSARRALRKAEDALRHTQREAFFEALAEALRSYFGNRLNLAPGDVTPDGLLQLLQEAQVEATLQEQVRGLFATCDQERFGAAGAATLDEATGRRLLQEVASLLRHFEKVRL